VVRALNRSRPRSMATAVTPHHDGEGAQKKCAREVAADLTADERTGHACASEDQAGAPLHSATACVINQNRIAMSHQQ